MFDPRRWHHYGMAPAIDDESAGGLSREDSHAVQIRPIRPDDRSRWVDLMGSMSWATRFKRGARRIEALGEADIDRAVNPKPPGEVAIVAIATGLPSQPMVGVVRGTRRDADVWAFTIVLLDEWQGRGIGSRLMEELIGAVRVTGARCIEGEVLATNRGMLDFVAKLGFEIGPAIAGAMVRRVVLHIPGG